MINFSVNQPDKNKQYLKRLGAYAIIKNDQDLIAVIKTKTGYFLPGGGVEDNESLEQCLKRECSEEMGALISIISNFAQGNYYFYSTTLNINMESIGSFFTARIEEFLDDKIEDDHQLFWLNLEKLIELLYLENQKEALRIFKKNFTSLSA